MTNVREKAFVLLKAIYTATRGDTQELVDSEKIVTSLGMERLAARGALSYLIDTSLVKDTREIAELPAVFITSGGVDAIEDSLSHPRIPTQYFPAVQNIINIQNLSGGSIQQGTVFSTQSIENTYLPTTEMIRLADELTTLRNALAVEAVEPEHHIAIGKIATAELAAKENNEPVVRKSLLSIGDAGKWVMATAEKIGLAVAAGAIKNYLNL